MNERLTRIIELILELLSAVIVECPILAMEPGADLPIWAIGGAGLLT